MKQGLGWAAVKARGFLVTYMVFASGGESRDWLKTLRRFAMRTAIVTHHDERTQEAAYYCQVRTLTIAVFVVGSATAGLLMVRAQEPRRTESSVAGRPIQVASDAYVSSNACRACHPSEYASWHASFHRTMTAGRDGRLGARQFRSRRRQRRARESHPAGETRIRVLGDARTTRMRLPQNGRHEWNGKS